jgi:predicted nuclease of restriction endonuclease-like (RecB) superfamily
MTFDNDYKKWLADLKSRIRQSQIKAAIAVNSALIEFYWDLGKMITEKEPVWGSKFIEQLANDLKMEFPDMQGLSRRNLFNAKKFYQFYNNTELVQQPVAQLQSVDKKESVLVQQLVALIPWGHNILIFTKLKEIKEALFYFEPEFAGKLNFYLTLIDKTMKRPNENPTIGILLCRGKDNLEVEYALQDIHKPMGVSEFKLGKLLPDNLKSSLPSIEEIEKCLNFDLPD